MSTSFLKATAVGMHLTVVAAAMVCSSSASAGTSIDFQVDASGAYIEQGSKFLIEADVDFQSPNLGFDAFGAILDVDEVGEPDTFGGFITLTGTLGDLTGWAAGALYQDPGGASLAGVFTISGGTGAYEGLSGSGVLNGLGVGQDAGLMTVSLAGTLGGMMTSTGACCFDDGSCEELESQECFQQDGVFNAVGTTCGDVECPIRGACCFPNGNCSVISVQECITNGGDFRGVGATCNDVDCDITAGSCCFLNTCIESTEEQCVGVGGVFQGVSIPCGAVTCTSFCSADIDGPGGGPDGNVDAIDILLLISQWGTPCTGTCEADITGAGGVPDGNVDALDYLELISQWGSPGNCP
jgi:hypothetical protein